MRRLDMSVEMWVLLPWCEPLFDDRVRDEARQKPVLLEVDVSGELARLTRQLRSEEEPEADV